MKKILFIGISFIGLLGMNHITNADNVHTNDMDTVVQDGEFKVSVAPGGLDFGTIQPTITEHQSRKVYYPVIKPNDFLFVKIPNMDTSWLGNEFDPDYSPIQMSPPAPGWGETPYMLKVFNNTFNNNEWKVKLSRTPFVSSNGNTMTGEQLYINNFYDRGDFKGKPTTKLAEFATVSEVPTLIASFEGESAQGLHLISPLVFGSNSNESYTEKNIVLVTDNHTYIPEAGKYSASLVWTVENAP